MLIPDTAVSMKCEGVMSNETADTKESKPSQNSDDDIEVCVYGPAPDNPVDGPEVDVYGPAPDEG